MASRWWIFIGTALCCSGVLLPIGIIILVWWFLDYIFNRDTPIVSTGKHYTDNTYNINNLNVHSDGKDHSDEDDRDIPMDYMSKDTRENMK